MIGFRLCRFDVRKACRRKGVNLAELLAELENIAISDKLLNKEIAVPSTKIAI